MSNPNPWKGNVPPLVRDSEAYKVSNSGPGHRFEKHQYARAFYRISPDGHVSVTSKFTNNKKWDGDHFSAVFVFRDEGGRVVVWTSHMAGLNGEAVGGPSDRYVKTRGRIDPADVNRIRTVTIHWGRPNIEDDRKIAARLLEIVKEIIGKDEEDSYRNRQLRNREEPGELAAYDQATWK